MAFLKLLAAFTPWSWLAPGVCAGCAQNSFLDVTEMCFEMFAGTIMCYGQTGAGKTYTMTGATENYRHRGILPRALQQVERAHGWEATQVPFVIHAADPMLAAADGGSSPQWSCD